MTLNSDFQKLYVDGLITLFELDASTLGAGILRFHGHISYQDWEKIYQSADKLLPTADSIMTTADKAYDVGEKVWMRNIVWNGEVFEPMALQVDGLEMNATGKASSTLQTFPALPFRSPFLHQQSWLLCDCRVIYYHIFLTAIFRMMKVLFAYFFLF